MSIKVLICDDQELARAGIRFALEGVTDIEIVGEADSAQAVYDLTEYLHPHVVLMDVVMPGENGISVTRKIAAHKNGTRILAVSMHTDMTYVRAMMEAGASGYVDKSRAYEELAQAIREVAAGREFLSEFGGKTPETKAISQRLTVAGEPEQEVAVPIGPAKPDPSLR